MRLLLFFLCLPLMLTVQQNKTTEQSFPIPSEKKAYFNLKFAELITVKSWNKNEILVKTNFTYDDKKLLEQYDEQISKGANLSFETGIKKNVNKKYSYNCWSCDDDNNNRDCVCFKYSYEIYAPKKCDSEY